MKSQPLFLVQILPFSGLLHFPFSQKDPCELDEELVAFAFCSGAHSCNFNFLKKAAGPFNSSLPMHVE